MIRDLGEIKVTPIEGPRDREGYPEGGKEHPGKNHPAFTRELIRACAFSGDFVWDPQAGTGTTMFEAARLGHLTAGWDICPDWREHWGRHFPAIETPVPGSVGVIVTSPAFLGTNHAPGASPLQEENFKRHGSKAGTGWKELPDGHLGHGQTIPTWMALAKPVVRRCWEALEPGGRMVWIVRDRIVNWRPAEFDLLNLQALRVWGFALLGFYWRRLIPTHNEQMRNALHERRKDEHQLRLLPVAEVERPTIDRELGIVARKPP